MLAVGDQAEAGAVYLGPRHQGESVKVESLLSLHQLVRLVRKLAEPFQMPDQLALPNILGATGISK